jgi:multiple sugar transport system substrate-binding protein
MRRKAVISNLALLGLFAAGCAHYRTPRPNEPVTLVFKHAKHPRYTALSQLIRQFETENPAIRVREEILPSSTDEQHQFYVINLAAHAEDFDVLDMDIIWVPEFARAGWLSPLNPSVTAAELVPLNQAALRADWLSGRLYAVPWFVDAGVLYYRKDLLAKYGLEPPRTYPELLETTRTVLGGEHDIRLLGFVWQGMQYEGLVCTALEFIRGNGGELLRGGANPALTEPATLDALEFMNDLIRLYKVTPPLVTTLNEEATRNIFQSGRAVFMRNWPYAWRLLNQSDSPVAGRVGITIVPHFPGQGSVPTMGGFHLGVNANSRHKTEAIAFLRYMIRRSVQKEVVLKLGVLPADTGVYRDPDVRQALPFLTDLLPALERAQPRPVTPYYLMISQIVQPELSAVVAGVRTPERAMRSADQQIRHLLEAQ